MVNDSKRHGINTLTEKVLKMMERTDPAHERDEDKDEGEGDARIAHVTPGEIVIPRRLQTPELMAALARAAQTAGLDPRRFQVGNRRNSVNPRTGQAEFAENPYVDPLAPLASLAGMRPPPTSIFPDPNSARGRAFDLSQVLETARVVGGESRNQPAAAQDEVLNSMLSRVGTERKRASLHDVLDQRYSNNPNRHQYNAIDVQPFVTQPIDTMAPAGQRASFDNIARASKGLIVAAVNGVDYRERDFRNLRADEPDNGIYGRMKFNETQPNYPKLYPKYGKKPGPFD